MVEAWAPGSMTPVFHEHPDDAIRVFGGQQAPLHEDEVHPPQRGVHPSASVQLTESPGDDAVRLDAAGLEHLLPHHIRPGLAQHQVRAHGAARIGVARKEQVLLRVFGQDPRGVRDLFLVCGTSELGLAVRKEHGLRWCRGFGRRDGSRGRELRRAAQGQGEAKGENGALGRTEARDLGP